MQKHHFVVHAEQMMAALLADLETLVNIDSGTYTKEGIDQVVLYLQSRFRALGFTTTIYEQQEYGNHLVVKHTGRVSDGPRILLIGHTDTVFPAGEVAQRPFQRCEMDGRQIASGPGILDMKSGLLMGLYALQILRQAGEEGYQSITMVCNSDEEIGSPSSRSLICDIAAQSDAVIVLEPGRQLNTIVSSRRGVGVYRVEAYGVSAHAGVNPQFGRNAIVELAHQIINLHALNNTINNTVPGATVNVGVIQGGERTNIVPDYAYCDIDVRVSNKQVLEALEDAMQASVQKTVFDGTKVILSGGIRSLPFEKTAGSAKLVALARQAAQELGIELVDVGSGGGSDANTTAGMGIPTVDGLGAGGAHAHNPGEYIELDYLPTRIALIAGLIQQICQYYQAGNNLLCV
jgi:glutamate carboxypeptidase